MKVKPCAALNDFLSDDEGLLLYVHTLYYSTSTVIAALTGFIIPHLGWSSSLSWTATKGKLKGWTPVYFPTKLELGCFVGHRVVNRLIAPKNDVNKTIWNETEAETCAVYF